MSNLQGLAAGDKVVKVISGGGTETASLATVAAIDPRRGLVSTDTEHVRAPEDIEDDGVQTYSIATGRAAANYIPGFTSRLIAFEG